MFIFDILQKEKVYQIISNNLRSLGIKYRIKKNALKTDKVQEKNAVSSKKIFNTSLSLLPLDVVTLSSGAITHVPLFLSQATEFLLKNVTQEGLFRKAGSQIRQKEIMARLDKGGTIGDKSSPIDIANSLKAFFRYLPEPLIPYAYQDLFVRCHMLKGNKAEALLLACLLLPPHHLNTLAFFMEFLKKVASFEKQNKMNIDNLARVIGPNIMPLPETTMVAVQSRLEIHLSIVKILIENAEKIGVLSDEVSEAISMDELGSIDNDLDRSDPSSSFQKKKKKHRSGSITRMFSGLKKIVGKTNSPNGIDNQENHLLVNEDNLLYTPLTFKAGKKRKIADSADSQSTKKCLVKENSPIKKPGMQKFLASKISSDKTKKIRLSLERFVPKNKSKINESENEILNQEVTPQLERRWSISSESKKRRRTLSIGPEILSPKAKIRNAISEKSLKISSEIPENATNNVTKPRRSDSSYFLRNFQANSTESTKDSEEFVKIPKSEFEEIKSRVSAIETQISQEFKSVANDSNNSLLIDVVDKVQSKYEKTLGEANIESITSADHLAKRLSKELRIRRSEEHKIIRSPSARKIGSMRRRSQERPVRKLQRTLTWHVSERPNLCNTFKSEQQLNNKYPKCNLKRGRPLVKRDSNKNLPSSANEVESYCSEETNTRLNYLQEQLNTLISQTAEHTCSFSDDDFNFQDLSYQKDEFIDNSQYFNNKVKELKKITNSQQNLSDCKTNSEPRKEKTVTWKDADNYFNQEAKMCTPVPQTGRASVAKLRTQNAGMVLAKARLFDEQSSSNDLQSRRMSVKIPRVKELKNDSVFATPSRSPVINKKHGTSPRSLKQKIKQSPISSPVLCNQMTSKETLSYQKENREIALSLYKNKTSNGGILQDSNNINIYKVNESPVRKTTPRIKKSLNVKTPKSAKSLSRKPVLNSRRTPLKAVIPMTPKRQSPRIISKSTQLINRNA